MAKKDRNSNGRKSRRGKPGIAAASVQAAPALLATPTPPVLSRRHKWLGRMALMVLLPGLLLSALEVSLRLVGYGYPTNFFLKLNDGKTCTGNNQFAWQFYRRELATAPHPLLMPAKKQPGTLRIFILGESAAAGTP